MSADSDPIITRRRQPDDFASILFDLASRVQFKLLVFMFIVFIIISSDVFIGRALARVKGAVEHKQPTSYGVILQGVFLTLSVLILDILISQGVI